MPITKGTPTRQAYGMREAAERLSLSKGHLYNLIQRGQLRAVRLGRRTLIPASEIDRLLGAGQE
jgi:excisionase family DNA binding protein